MISETIPHWKKLSLAKKRRLISEMVDEVYGEPVQKADLADALQTRIDHYHRHPGSARTWVSVKARLRKRK